MGLISTLPIQIQDTKYVQTSHIHNSHIMQERHLCRTILMTLAISYLIYTILALSLPPSIPSPTHDHECDIQIDLHFNPSSHTQSHPRLREVIVRVESAPAPCRSNAYLAAKANSTRKNYDWFSPPCQSTRKKKNDSTPRKC
jgi:hypothetical protein